MIFLLYCKIDSSIQEITSCRWRFQIVRGTIRRYNKAFLSDRWIIGAGNRWFTWRVYYLVFAGVALQSARVYFSEPHTRSDNGSSGNLSKNGAESNLIGTRFLWNRPIFVETKLRVIHLCDTWYHKIDIIIWSFYKITPSRSDNYFTTICYYDLSVVNKILLLLVIIIRI